VHVANAHAGLVHEFGEVFGHALGERRHQRAIPLGGGCLALGDAVLHLIFYGSDFHRRVDEAGGADHLFGEDTAGLFHLPAAGRGADRKGLRAHRVPFVEPERTVVDAAWQAEAVFGERQLAAVVPARHRADLRHGLVAFIDEQQRVFGQVFE